MAANASFNFDDGMRTVSCMATFPFRMRVSMSATGSVIVIGGLPSPARLGDAGNLAGVHHLAEADAAEPELAEHRARPSAPPAAGVGPHPELGLALLLLHESLLGQWKRLLACQVRPRPDGTGTRTPPRGPGLPRRRRRWSRS